MLRTWRNTAKQAVTVLVVTYAVADFHVDSVVTNGCGWRKVTISSARSKRQLRQWWKSSTRRPSGQQNLALRWIQLESERIHDAMSSMHPEVVFWSFSAVIYVSGKICIVRTEVTAKQWCHKYWIKVLKYKYKYFKLNVLKVQVQVPVLQST